MSVAKKQRKNGAVVHYVVTTWQGKRVWEKSGKDAREAARLDRRRIAEVAAGTYQPSPTAGLTVGTYAERWLAARTNAFAENEERFYRLHVLGRSPWFARQRLDDVRPVHIKRLVDELAKPYVNAKGKPAKLSVKSVSLAYGVVTGIFRDARLAEHIDHDPCILPPGTIRRGITKRRLPYSAEEARAMLSPALPIDRRVLAGLALMTGMREGEIAGRRWRDIDDGPSTLSALTVASQYQDLPLKTDRAGDTHPRAVPILPELAALLTEWWRSWELYYLRPPTLDDFILPHRDTLESHSKSSLYKAWRRACVGAGVTNRSLHSTRHTFISMARRGGARKDVLERVTHNAQGDVVDTYTHWDWAPLCEAVLCLPAAMSVDVQVDAARVRPVITAPAPGLEPRGRVGRTKEPAGKRGKRSRAVDAAIPEGSTWTDAEGSARLRPGLASADPFPYFVERGLYDVLEQAEAAGWEG